MYFMMHNCSLVIIKASIVVYMCSALQKKQYVIKRSFLMIVSRCVILVKARGKVIMQIDFSIVWLINHHNFFNGALRRCHTIAYHTSACQYMGNMTHTLVFRETQWQ